MRALRRPRIPPHKILHQMRAHRARVPRNIPRQLQRPRKHLLRGQDLREQLTEQRRGGGVHRACGDEVHRPRQADQPRQEERAGRLHHDPASSKHEPDLRLRAHDTNVHRQRHRDAHADGGAVDGGYDGLGAAVDC